MKLDFDSILSSILGAVNGLAEASQEAMRKEYERGVAEGRRLAAEEMRTKIVAVLNVMPEGLPSPEIQPYGSLADENVVGGSIAARAPRGSVEPKILGALSTDVRGKKPHEIAEETGVPENSVRGKLNKLRKDGRVFKVGDVWRFAGPIQECDGSLVQLTPDGKIVSVSANHAVNGNPGSGEPGQD